MAQRPNKNFCALAGMSHPAPEELWHPREFTLERLGEVLQAFAKENYMFTPFRHFAGSAAVSEREPNAPRYACIAVPVCFSPSQAVKLAAVISDTDDRVQPRQHLRGVFFFESKSPSYSLDDPRTRSAIAEISNGGHEIGIMLGVEQDMTAEQAITRISDTMRSVMTAANTSVVGVTFRSVGVSAKQVEALRTEIAPFLKKMNIATTHDTFSADTGIATSSNGVYKNGHPLSIIEDKKPLALLNFVECWYSQEPKWALDRLGTLPEVDANVPAVTEQYLNRVKVPVLGATHTREVVPESEHWFGRTGFREGMKLQASG